MSVHPVTFAELDWFHCRWPVEVASAPMMYCGDHIERHSSYCSIHRRMAYTNLKGTRAQAEMRGREMARERRDQAAKPSDAFVHFLAEETDKRRAHVVRS